jgi:TolA-binding protein
MSDESEVVTPSAQSYLENAVAAMEEASTEEAATETAPSSEPVAIDPGRAKPEAKTDDKAAPVVEGPDPLAELEQKIAARRAKREEKQAPDTSSEVAQLRQQIAELQGRYTNDSRDVQIAKLAREGRWRELAEASGHDPLNAYESFTKQAADSGKDQLERKIAALEAKLNERDETEKQQRERQQAEAQQREQAEVHNQAIRGFLDFSDTSDKHPTIKRVPASRRARDAVYWAGQLQAAGEDVTYARVADLMEAEYGSIAQVGKTGTNGAASKADAGGPKTITNDLAAQSAGADDRPLSRDEYLRNAVSVIRANQ